MVNKTELMVQTLNNSPNNIITLQQIQNNIGIKYEHFSAMKSNINSNKKKWKDVQIVRAGKYGNSVWKLAEDDTQASLKYNDMRTKRAIRSIVNSYKTGMLVIANENNVRIRQDAVLQMANQKQALLTAVV